MAPEVLSGQAYTTKADVYSFAMTMYELYTNLIPYDSTEFPMSWGIVISFLLRSSAKFLFV